jgi:hypothetical protein
MKKTIALIFVASTLVLVGCSTTHQAGRWEYREAQGIDEVNQLAAHGWTVVGFSTSQFASGQGSGVSQLFILKRLKQ